MKKRISIYIDGDLWEDVKTESWRRSHETKTGVSASQFTEDALRSFLSILPGAKKHPDSFSPAIKAFSDELSEASDDEIIAKAQEKLEAVRADKKVSTAKGPVKANAAMESFFNPIPKAKWKGAK